MLSAWPSNGEEEDGGDGSPERPEVRLVTTRPVAAGESLEIRENYGNADLLCKYGFVDLDRRSERNAFTFEVSVYASREAASREWGGGSGGGGGAGLLHLCIKFGYLIGHFSEFCVFVAPISPSRSPFVAAIARAEEDTKGRTHGGRHP